MQIVGPRRPPPTNARVRTAASEYVVELDVPDFAMAELTAELVGAVVVVRGDQVEAEADKGRAFRLHERFEESFRLPDDVDRARMKVLYRPGVLELRVPRIELTRRRLRIERSRSGVELDANTAEPRLPMGLGFDP